MTYIERKIIRLYYYVKCLFSATDVLLLVFYVSLLFGCSTKSIEERIKLKFLVRFGKTSSLVFEILQEENVDNTMKNTHVFE